MSSPGARGGSARSMIVALGGNAIIRVREHGTIEEQFHNAIVTLAPVAKVIAGGAEVVLSHGNGPIVGNILFRNEAARAVIPPMPLDVCGADSQGGIGYMMQQVLRNELSRLGKQRAVATIVTQVVVDEKDPAFERPTKPIGPFFGPSEARALREKKGWTMVEDSGRGFRRVVASPQPRDIVELDVIRALLAEGAVVIAGGGGGIPVIRDAAGALRGVEAVVDKDRSSTLLALKLGIPTLVFLTAVPEVRTRYGEPDEAPIHDASAKEMADLLRAGEFPAGSMGPKIEAALRFLESGGELVVITDPESFGEAIAGRAGTRISKAGTPVTQK